MCHSCFRPRSFPLDAASRKLGRRGFPSLFLGLLTIVAGAVPAAAAPPAPAIQVKDAYVRAVPPGQPISAMFMQLRNGSEKDQVLVGAESSICRVAELHTHKMEDGMMKMRRVDRIELPAGTTVVLEPGGLHIMLIGLKKQLIPGDAVNVNLVFGDGSRETVMAPVREIEMPPMGGGGH